jgi:arylalkylamine N-acetyltransferase
MDGVTIRAACRSDLSLVHCFLNTYFHDTDPLESSHIDKTDKMKVDDAFVLSCIECETTLMAFEDGKLVAVLIAGSIDVTEPERNLECAKGIDSPKIADILRFLSYIEEKADFCRRLGVSSSLHIHIVSVHPAYQGRGIAKQLFKVCMSNGSVKKFPALSIDCSNIFMAKIADEFGMTCISTVTYEEYNQHTKKELFVPKEPNLEIKSYAKVL